MRSTQIRSTFLDFFTSRGHRHVPSSSLIPADPTLLLTNAGMNQFKPSFLGEAVPEFRRATSVQKCARTSDIENVGRTNRHATFFEMLGNFSFGDYFKREAIAYAWELMTAGFGLPKERLWITVFRDDDEAERIWRSMGVPASRIQRLGMADNFWSMGVPGPCGPSSEIAYDRGPAFGREGGPAVDGERYIELWNLVFMQSQRGEGEGKEDFPILGDLAAKSIDTGLGLDRLAAILQDVENVCRTDLLSPTLARVQELTGRAYPGTPAEKVSFQVVTEHARSVAFLIADGVLPGRDGRGYILRRLARRAIRHARLLGATGPVLADATTSVVANLGEVWPELTAQASLIEQVVTAEEESFGRTLSQGSRLLDAAVVRARRQGSASLGGDTAFELHDTYGFPIELTIEAAREAGLSVDADRFAALLAEQRRRAKAGGKAKTAEALARMDTYRQVAAEHGRTEFVGYQHLAAEAAVVGLIVGGDPVPAAVSGQRVEVVLDRSPFYAEAGGQVGDTGTLRAADGTLLRVLDTRPGLEGLHIHTATVVSGEIHAGAQVEATVDRDRRAAVARSHSATHVLHATLRQMLGEHARQQGSRVDAGRLRFDFAHFAAVDPQQLAAIESLVNERLLADPEVRIWHASRAEAEAAGATALFGEKYGDRVRVVDIGDFSRELCGGTHVSHGAGAGPIRILGEASIGANLRRVEALTGHDALRHQDLERRLLGELATLLGVKPQAAPDVLRDRLAALGAATKQLATLRAADLRQRAERLAAHSAAVGVGRLVVQQVEDVEPGELPQFATDALARIGARPAIVILGAAQTGKAQLVAVISDDLHQRGAQASSLLTDAARTLGGGAGGTSPVANAGGRHPGALPQALTIATQAATDLLSADG